MSTGVMAPAVLAGASEDPTATQPGLVGAGGQPRLRAHWISRFALAVLLVAGSAAFVPIVLPGSTEQEDGSGSGLAQIVFVCCYATLLAAGLLRPTARPRGTLPGPATYAIVTMAGASVLWSLSPDVSLRRSVGLLLTVATGSMLPRIMSLRELLGVVRATCWCVSLSTVVYLVVAGSSAADLATPDALRGVFTTKNELGRFSAFAALIFLASVLLTSGWPRRRSWLGLGMVLTLLGLSRSATSMTVTVVLAVLLLTMNDVRHRGGRALAWIVPAGLVGVAAMSAGWLLLELSGITRLVGRDATFTGRVDLWSLVMDAIQRRPWFGYGYQAFWVTPGGPADDIRARLSFPVPHAHDGFLDLWLDLGVVAVLVIAALLAHSLFRSIAATARGSRTGLICFAVVTFMIASNITESDLLRANSCYLVTMFAVLAYLGAHRHHRTAMTRQ